MGKYNVGDKVVIRKELEIGKDYGDFKWYVRKEHLKEKDYVVISKYYGEAYEIDECIITDEMISHKYEYEDCSDSEKNIKTIILKSGIQFKCNITKLVITDNTDDIVYFSYNNPDMIIVSSSDFAAIK